MKRNKSIVSVVVLVLLVASAFMGIFVNTSLGNEPDYSYDMDLPADGSNDTGNVYSVTRSDNTESGHISIEFYKEEMKGYINLTNVRAVTIYFNATDVDFDKYMGWLNTFGAEIDIIINSDVGLLDGEFHSVPNPDKVLLNGEEWGNYNQSEDVFSFDDLEMSTNTITLSYTAELVDIMKVVIVVGFLIFFTRKMIDFMKDFGKGF